MNADAVVWWKNVESFKDTLPKLTGYCWDTIGNSYKIVLDLIFFRDTRETMGNSEQLAPGLFLVFRKEKRQAV